MFSGSMTTERTERAERTGKRCFKRLETDAEFRKRLREEHNLVTSAFSTTAELDDIAWDQRKVQWRIVEDVA